MPIQSNEYKVEPPFYVSFSGGRTSGYLLRHVLDAWGGSLPPGGFVLFANTGREHAATYAFVAEVARRWCPVVWVEYHDSGYRVVTADTASRNGEPFARLIEKRKYLPNPVTRFCTSDLKVNPMKRFMRDAGYKDFTTVIGLRADEPARVSRIRADPERDMAMPMADAGVTRNDVVEWWSRQEFDLHLPDNDQAFGNCDLCFLKGVARLERVMQAEPERAAWWIEQEAKIGAAFRRDRPNYRQMLTQVTIQGQLFQDRDDTTIPCDCTE